ncbi:MAG: dienelactone hydrolase family protein [Gammaproteobacteria bacterium]|nr:dienelactone hydrolase family protein [Gammaproteobacteria bacterium]
MHTIETVEVLGNPMEVFVFAPQGGGPHPGIVLAQHIPVGHTGIENDEFTLAAGERFAADGYVVAAPFIFHWWPKDADIQVKRDESRDDWMAADMRAAFDVLRAREDVDSERIGVVGHCWGGRVAWIAACRIPELAACATFYGGNVKVAKGDGSAPIDEAHRIRCPVVGFFGNDDQNPSPADVDDYSAALTKAGVEHVFHRYDGAGHAFQNFPAPERYREAQSEDAWQKVLEFLAEKLK